MKSFIDMCREAVAAYWPESSGGPTSRPTPPSPGRPSMPPPPIPGLGELGRPPSHPLTRDTRFVARTGPFQPPQTTKIRRKPVPGASPAAAPAPIVAPTPRRPTEWSRYAVPGLEASASASASSVTPDRDQRRRELERTGQDPVRMPTYPTLSVWSERGSDATSADERSVAAVSPGPRNEATLKKPPKTRINPETGRVETWEPINNADDEWLAAREHRARELRARINERDMNAPLDITDPLDAACLNAALAGTEVVDLNGVPGYDPKLAKGPD
jgi:hypothetical protein